MGKDWSFGNPEKHALGINRNAVMVGIIRTAIIRSRKHLPGQRTFFKGDCRQRRCQRQSNLRVYVRPLKTSWNSRCTGIYQRDGAGHPQGRNGVPESPVTWIGNIPISAKSLQSCATLCDTMDCSPPGSSVHGILQARILEWVAMPSSMVSSWPRDWTCVSYISCIGRRVLYH